MSGAPARAWRRAQRTGWRWAVAGAVLGLAIGVVAYAPASWLAGALADASDGRALLADAQGSVWSGSAVAVLTGGPGSRDAVALPGRLHWRIAPSWSGLRLSIDQACCMNERLTLHWRPRWGGFALELPARSGATELGHWPAAWLAGLGTPWNTLQMNGQLRLASSGFTLQWAAGRSRLSGALSLDLQDASSRVAPVDPLGSYRLSLRGEADEAIGVALSTLDGALRMSGSGQWIGARLRFRGEASAAAGQEAALSNLLNIIGRRQGAQSVLSIG